ncbi:MAG: hypothetical protein AAGF12_05130 [Myxococcota bacterium]
MSKQWLFALAIAAAFGCDDCLKQVPAENVELLPYPECEPGSGIDGPSALGAGELRAGPSSSDQNVVERFHYEIRDCHRVMTVRQEWPRGTSDIEVIYDAEGTLLRAWKRTTSPLDDNPEEQADIRRYELRTEQPTMTIRFPDGRVEHRILRGSRPTAAIGPGRGMLTAWIQRADLDVGERSREEVLDFRSLGLERILPVALVRNPDREEPDLGRVRVYTVYGRESVFTDENNVVIGDLAGIRPFHVVAGEPPRPIPVYGEPDPVHTP